MSLFTSIFYIADNRVKGRTKYPLDFILLITFIATLCEKESWYEIYDFSVEYELELLKLYETLSQEKVNSIPSHDTLNRVFQLIDPSEMETVYSRFIEHIFGEQKVKHLCFDGKTQRGVKKLDFNTEGHVVSAFDPKRMCSVAQRFISKKETEVSAILEMISMLDISDTVITADAIATQTSVVSSVLEKRGDYILVAKDNQKYTKVEIEDAFKPANKQFVKTLTTEDYGYGRIETRKLETISHPIETLEDEEFTTLLKWSGLKSIHKLTRTRTQKKTGNKSEEIVYLISSLTDQQMVMDFTRKHWAIETNLHYMLDVYMAEDQMQKRAGNVAKNMNIFLKCVLTILTKLKEKEGKSVRRIRKILASKSPHDILNIVSEL